MGKVIKNSSVDNTYAFIDASNIIYGAKDEGWLLDQQKLYKYLKSKFDISKAFFYFGKDSKRFAKTNFIALENQRHLIERKA